MKCKIDECQKPCASMSRYCSKAHRFLSADRNRHAREKAWALAHGVSLGTAIALLRGAKRNRPPAGEASCPELVRRVADLIERSRS